MFDKLGDPLMKSGVLLAKTFLATLGTMAAASAIDSDIQNKQKSQDAWMRCYKSRKSNHVSHSERRIGWYYQNPKTLENSGILINEIWNIDIWN